MPSKLQDRAAAGIAAVFCTAVLCVYPLYLDKFSNLGLVKFTGVQTLLLAGSLAMGLCALCGASAPGRFGRRDAGLWGLALFAAANVAATVASLSPWASLWGLGGYYGGLALALGTGAAYLAVRAFARPAWLEPLFFGMGVTASLVTLLYLCNVFDLDPIGAYRDMAVQERVQFFSTLGQHNFNAGFLALLLPMVYYAFLYARGRGRVVAFGVPALLCTLAPAIVEADGLVLGLGVATLVLICQKRFTTTTLRRLALLGMGFFAWLALLGGLRARFPTNGQPPRLAGLLDPAWGFLACAALWALLWRLCHGPARSLCVPGRVVAGAVLAVAAALVLLANFCPGFPSLGPLDELLVFSDSWGTWRGTAWRAAWGIWRDGTPLRKLVGVGPGMMHTAVQQWPGAAQIENPYLATFYAAHNEYLEQLMTTGVLGLAGWLVFIVAHLRRAFANMGRRGVAPVTLALCSYLAQAAVSIRVSMIFPEVMVLFGLLAAACAPAAGQPAGVLLPGPAKPAPPPWRRCALVAALAVGCMAACGAASRLAFGFLY